MREVVKNQVEVSILLPLTFAGPQELSAPDREAKVFYEPESVEEPLRRAGTHG
jgi:hypothetical protein